MKIATELLTLTREHHTSLSLANKCVNTVKSSDNKAIQALCLSISKSFKPDFFEHFETEETTIFKPLMNKTSSLSILCKQLISEHQQLYQMADNLPENPASLLEFGQLLKSHTRMEDKEVFPNINLLSENEKRVIVISSEKHRLVTKI